MPHPSGCGIELVSSDRCPTVIPAEAGIQG